MLQRRVKAIFLGIDFEPCNRLWPCIRTVVYDVMYETIVVEIHSDMLLDVQAEIWLQTFSLKHFIIFFSILQPS